MIILAAWATFCFGAAFTSRIWQAVDAAVVHEALRAFYAESFVIEETPIKVVLWAFDEIASKDTDCHSEREHTIST
jgi:hypothetical protein